jgi:hypothetical protein
MAIVALGHNGIGLGHVSRIITICEMLARAGGRPLLLTEGVTAYSAIPHSIPSAAIPKICYLSPKERHQMEGVITSLARLSSPSVVIEDTHPLGLTLDSDQLTRILILRPITWTTLLELRRGVARQYKRVFVADQPQSPTWPYTERQTATISSWSDWHFVGPVYRSPTASEIDEVRRRYGWSAVNRICVFSMGGGGEHFGASDARMFVKKASRIASRLRQLDPSAQSVFVKGPLFSEAVRIPSCFRVVDQEPLMPALFVVADAAVLRPGFNSVWECIAGNTPIIPISGTSYQEPIPARLKRLNAFGLLSHNIEDVWKNKKTKMTAGRPRAEWFGSLGTDLDSRLIGFLSRPESTIGVTEKGRSTTAAPKVSRQQYRPFSDCLSPTIDRLRSLLSSKVFTIRIDDVTQLDERTAALIDIVSIRGVRFSLEIIPYLCGISDLDLRKRGLNSDMAEVGQHGYSHIQREPLGGRKSEFSLNTSEVPIYQVEELATGKQTMEQRFPRYFRRGFSAPYDGLPSWLAETWQQLGGEFISVIRQRPYGARLRAVVNSIDLWDWTNNRLIDVNDTIDQIYLSTIRLGYAGLVLHPQHFCDQNRLSWLDSLLRTLESVGFRSVLPSRIAQLQAQRIQQSPNRQYESLA